MLINKGRKVREITMSIYGGRRKFAKKMKDLNRLGPRKIKLSNNRKNK